MADPDLPKPAVLELVRAALAETFAPDCTTTLYTHKQLKTCRTAFAAKNDAFRTRLGARGSAVPALELQPFDKATVFRDELGTPT